jgi:formylglycine-generating enzyme required for sulfatase activity
MVAYELNKLNELRDINKVARILALESQDMVSNRVQRDGKDASGSKMVTKSPEKYGAYSKSYGKYQRSNKGFQTSKIDFTVDGSLWSAWRVFPLTNTSIGVGFYGQEIEKAAWLEDMFGNVFELTTDETADILELATIKVNEIMSK